MPKQNLDELKKSIGYTSDLPVCSNCEHYTCELGEFGDRKKQRCHKYGFAVRAMTTCKNYSSNSKT